MLGPQSFNDQAQQVCLVCYPSTLHIQLQHALGHYMVHLALGLMYLKCIKSLSFLHDLFLVHTF